MLGLQFDPDGVSLGIRHGLKDLFDVERLERDPTRPRIPAR
jgi:hypothetical protein